MCSLRCCSDSTQNRRVEVRGGAPAMVSIRTLSALIELCGLPIITTGTRWMLRHLSMCELFLIDRSRSPNRRCTGNSLSYMQYSDRNAWR
jgi:hypothetical protein